jgi:phage replication O-like protein O
MASPQKENGYTTIANEILERLCHYGINGSEYRIILYVLRKTYGFHKTRDRISLSQFEKGTLMDRSQAVKTIRSLVQKNIIKKDNGIYVFNKNWEEWVVTKRSPSVQKVTTASDQKVTKSSVQKVTYKRKKETITKEKASSNDADVISEVIYLFSEFNPACKKFYGNKTQRSAVSSLIETYGLEQVKKVVLILPQTNQMAYVPTITTPHQLEQGWVRLESALKKKKASLQEKYKVAFV